MATVQVAFSNRPQHKLNLTVNRSIANSTTTSFSWSASVTTSGNSNTPFGTGSFSMSQSPTTAYVSGSANGSTAFGYDYRSPNQNSTISLGSATRTAPRNGSNYTWTLSVSMGGLIGSATAVIDLASFDPEVVTYSLSYNAAGGSPTPGSQSLQSAATFTAGAAPSRSGYTFEYWSGSNGNTYFPNNTYSMPASNLTLTAVWSLTTYSLSYNANGGSPTPSGQNLAPGDTFFAQAAPSRSGYTFDYWFGSNATVYYPNNSYSMPAYNLTLTASWTLNPIPSFTDSTISLNPVMNVPYTSGNGFDGTVTATDVSSFSIFSTSPPNGYTAGLPTGMSATQSGNSYVISGTPTRQGLWAFRIAASNVGGTVYAPSASTWFQLQVLAPGKRGDGSDIGFIKRFIGVGQTTTDKNGNSISADAEGYVYASRVQRYDGSQWIDATN